MKKYILSVLLLSACFSFTGAQVVGDVPPPTSGSSCTDLQYNLTYKKSKDSNTNGEVSDLQSFLQEQGLLNSDPTGYFGALTFSAVKAFQTQNNLAAYGYVGPLTRAAIKNISCGGGPVSNAKLEFFGMSSSYAVGEKISITITNSGTVNATLPVGVGCDLGYFGLKIGNINNSQDVIYHNPSLLCGAPPSNIILKPGETKTLGVWDQNEWKQTSSGFNNYTPANVASGSYVISVYGISKIISIGSNSSSPTISSLQSNGNPIGTIASGQRAAVYGAGLMGQLTIRLGSQNPIVTNSTSNTYAEFDVPSGLTAGVFNVTVTNQAGAVSNNYNVNIIVPTTTTCSTLYWFDNTDKSCSQKQFCGAYMYQGLQTFSTQSACLSAVGNTNSPIITGFSPTSGPVGTTVTINGTGFMDIYSKGPHLYFGKDEVTVKSFNATTVTFDVPSTISNCPANTPAQYCGINPTIPMTPGVYTIAMKNSSGVPSNNVSFTVTGGTTGSAPTFSNTRIFKDASGNIINSRTLLPGQFQFSSVTTTNANSLRYSCVGSRGETKAGPHPLQLIDTVGQSWATIISLDWIGTYNCTWTVTGPGGTVTYVEPAFTFSSGNTTVTPTITSLSPTSGPVGTAVTINGTGFNPSSNDIYIDGKFIENQTNSNNYTYNSINFTIPSYFPTNCPNGAICVQGWAMMSPGVHTISVKNANGMSNAFNFTVTGGTTVSAPKITSLSPTSGPIGTTVRIDGTGFVGGSSNDIYLDDKFIESKKVFDAVPSSLSFTIPSYFPQNCNGTSEMACTNVIYPVNPGPHTISVKNTNGMSNAANFTVTGNTTSNVPTVYSPNGGETWISKTNQKISWNDITPKPPICPSGAYCPTYMPAQPKVYDIYLSYYIAPCPSIPDVACMQGMPAPLKIATSFSGSTYYWTVGSYVSGYGTNSTQYVNDGKYMIQVCESNTTNCDTSDQFFSIVSTPVITTAPYINSLSPTSGPTGTVAHIFGTGFLTSNDFYLDGKFIETKLSSGNPQELRFSIPSYFPPNCNSNYACTNMIALVNPGNHVISIKNANGISNSVTFTVSGGTTVSAPTIASLSPATGPTETIVYIYGTGFTSDSVIYFNGKEVKNLQKYNNSQISFSVPSTVNNCPAGAYCNVGPVPLSPGTYSVVVKNLNPNLESNTAWFTVTGTTGNLAITTTSLSNGTVGQAYDGVIEATGLQFGNWNITGGQLPPGLYLNPVYCTTDTVGGICIQRSIAISGIPTTPGTYTFTATVTAEGQIASKQLTIVVNQTTTPSSPGITYIFPTYGPVGTTVTINGTGFNPSSNDIYIDGKFIENQTNYNNYTYNSINFNIPAYFPQNCNATSEMACTNVIYPVNPGVHTISVKNTNGMSNAVNFTVTGGMVYPSQPISAVQSISPTVLGDSTICVDLPYNMYRGYEDNNVKNLQSFFVEKGLLTEQASGFYGDKTVSAVKDYQAMKGLPQTGMVYDFTRAAIKAESCK